MKRNMILLAPAIYFAGVGVVCIIMDIVNSTFSWYWLCIYALLCLPLVLRKRLVWKIFGVFASLVFGYLLLAVIVWYIQYLNGRHFQNPLQTFGVGFTFLTVSIAAAVALIFVGRVQAKNNTASPGRVQ